MMSLEGCGGIYAHQSTAVPLTEDLRNTRGGGARDSCELNLNTDWRADRGLGTGLGMCQTERSNWHARGLTQDKI